MKLLKVDKQGYKEVKAEDNGEETFVGYEFDKDSLLVHCPLCGMRNHEARVKKGECAWCGFNLINNL